MLSFVLICAELWHKKVIKTNCRRGQLKVRTKGARETERASEHHCHAGAANRSLHHIFMYLSNYFLLKVTAAVVISRAGMGSPPPPLHPAHLQRYNYIWLHLPRGKWERAQRVLFILIGELTRLFAYISASSTPGPLDPAVIYLSFLNKNNGINFNSAHHPIQIILTFRQWPPSGGNYCIFVSAAPARFWRWFFARRLKKKKLSQVVCRRNNLSWYTFF